MRSKKVPCHGKFGEEEELEFLDDIQAGMYRSLIGILLYMAPDRLDC